MTTRKSDCCQAEVQVIYQTPAPIYGCKKCMSWCNIQMTKEMGKDNWLEWYRRHGIENKTTHKQGVVSEIRRILDEEKWPNITDAIIELIDRDVIGEDNPTIFGGLINQGHSCYPEVVKGQNRLRAEQRARLKGGRV